MKSSDIKRIMDESLSDMHMSEQSMNAVMHRIQNAQQPRVRRMRKGAIIAVAVLVLMLIGTIAIATMSLMGVFERSFEIEQEEEALFIDDWSLDHQIELIELLLSVGEDLNVEKTEQLYSDDLTEEEKSELAVDILEECYNLNGGYLDTLSLLVQKKGPIVKWTHEERAWLSEQLNTKLEYVGDVRFLVPTESDLSEEEAYEIAYQYYEETLGLGRECFDTTRQFSTFGEMLNEDYTITKNWHLSLFLNIDHYDGKELQWENLDIEITTEGNVVYAGELQFRTWQDEWTDLLLSEGFWTIDGLCEFKEEWELRAKQLESEGAELTRDLRYLLSKPYGRPGEGDISLEDAYAIAERTLLSLPGWEEEMLAYYGTREAYYAGDPNQYCIVYTIFEAPAGVEYEALNLNIDGEIPASVRICINAATGEITEIHQNQSDWDIPERLGI